MALLVLAAGCRNTTTMRCERETALLRAEILDLEDKYYALQSQYRSGVGSGIGTGVGPIVSSGVIGNEVISNGVISNGVIGNGVIGSGVIGSGVIQGSPVVINSAPIGIDGYPIGGDVIYDDQIIHGNVVPGTVIPGTVIPGTVLQGTMMPTLATPVEGEIYYEGSIPVDETVTDPSADSVPVSEGSESGAFNFEPPVLDEATSGSEHTLMLPDANELEVGFEELELELSSDLGIDRIEIVPDATHGIDLDGVPGHDGIELMIRAINSDDEFVEQTGELTVTVKDSLAGEIGKWTFLPKELELFLSRDEFGNMGTLLHLPWTDRIPVGKQIEIRVAMMLGNVEYIASQQIQIKPPTGQSAGGPIVGWAADDNRWVSRPTTRIQPRQFQPGRQVPATPTSVYDKPSTAVQRPVWKPVR